MASNTPNSTNTLARSVNFAQNFVRNAPLTFSGTNDPAFLMADWVRQFLLGPPFAWRWNRTTFSFPTALVPGTQDYTFNLPTFGWLEKGVVIDNTASPAVTYELDVFLDIGQESARNLPTKIAAQFDDGNGNITFRFTPPPDKAYSAIITYQNSAPIFESLQDTWAPIPDYFSFLYNQGLLAKTYEYLGDPRFSIAMPLFLRQVIAANSGLDETQVNIFLPERLEVARETQDVLSKSQQGRAGRGMYGA